jgi:uncharacterized protein YgbK (DUF1537 family)
MTLLRLIGDDLTGALDTAAQFAVATRPIPVFWGELLPASLPAAFAIDAGTRETDDKSSAVVAARHAPLLAPGPGVIAFRKLDSLLRGHGGLELAATLRAAPVAHCVIAPAFPFHGRVTRGGRQFVFDGGTWQRVGEDLRATLESQGMMIRTANAGEPVPAGISLWDAETDDDLRRIADAGRRLAAPVLWCGSGGLAAALAGREAPAVDKVGRPILGLFGTDHPATAAQLGACGEHVLWLKRGDGEAASLVSARLDRAGVCLVAFDFPPGGDRSETSGHIAREMVRLTGRIPPPRSLLVSGGETLRALCLSLGGDHLDVFGQMIPGVPVSVVRGGNWDGVRVVSKSGAFGDNALLRRLLGLDDLRPETMGAR